MRIDGMLASAFIGLVVFIIGMIVVWLTPSDQRPSK